MGGLLGLARGIDRINTIIGRTVGWAILVAVLVSAGNAIVRKVMNTSSNAWLELQWYLFGVAFLGAAAYTLLENEHIRIDIVYGRWSRRTQHWIDLIGHLLFLMPFTTLMIWMLWPWVRKSYRIGEISMNAGGLILWPAKALILAAFILLPLAQVVILAFTATMDHGAVVEGTVGLMNFANLWDRPELRESILNSAIYVTLNVALCIAVGLPAASLRATAQARGRSSSSSTHRLTSPMRSASSPLTLSPVIR